MFMDAILEYGVPSRVQGDRGGENRDVSIVMILMRGINRSSFMWGSSTRNTRIEQLWVEVGTQFARRWRAFFQQLEKYHHLNPGSPTHLWLLHHLFLGSINEDCELFQENWNSHPISGLGHFQSPNVRVHPMPNDTLAINDRSFYLGHAISGSVTARNICGGGVRRDVSGGD